MRFSYSLIKQFIPQLKSKAQAMEMLTLYAFEAEDAGGDVIEVKLPPNRYADSASHFGIAKELTAKGDWTTDVQIKKVPVVDLDGVRTKPLEHLKVDVVERRLCPRYLAAYVDGVRVGPSPAWLKKALEDCGLRSISNVVDIMNYAMLEVGQPLHAFDAAKVKDDHIVVRKAKRGEKITSIDGVRYSLDLSMLVIADPSKPLAIAGIKGGTGSEVTEKTTRLIVEAANFEPASVYGTSKALKLTTDASLRFAHALSPALAEFGLARSLYLLKELAGATVVEYFDSQKKPLTRKILKFDVERCNRLIGAEFTKEEAASYLRRLGFKRVEKDLWEAPPFRTDIETHEDLAEEVVRLFGLNKLKAKPPVIALKPSVTDEIIVLKDKVRKILAGLGVSEVYSNSFISDDEVKTLGFNEEAVQLMNPLSRDLSYLRPSLAPLLLRAAEENMKFMSEAKIFEIGKIFWKDRKKIIEHPVLGVVFASKRKLHFFELKGVVAELLRESGIVDYIFAEPAKSDWPREFTRKFVNPPTLLKIGSDGEIVGYIGNAFHREKEVWQNICEIDLDKLLELAEGENEYLPLPKYPSVMRDVSILVDGNARIGDVVEEVQLTNPKLIADVDLVDEYADPKWAGKQSLTLRVVFQAPDRTLTGGEVDKEMEKVTAALKKRFRAKIR